MRIHPEKQRGTNCHIAWRNGKGDKLSHYWARHEAGQIVTFLGGDTKGDKLSHFLAPLPFLARWFDPKYSSRDPKGDKLSHYLGEHERGTNYHIAWPPCSSGRDALTRSIHRGTRSGTNCHISWRDTKGDKLSLFLASFAVFGHTP